MSLDGSSLSSLEQCLKMALSMKNKLTDRFVDFAVILNQHCYWKRRSMKALKKKTYPFSYVLLFLTLFCMWRLKS